LKADLETKEAIFALEKELILKRLELKQAAITEEELEDHEDESNPKKLLSSDKGTPDVSLETENNRIQDWVENLNNEKEPTSGLNELIKFMTCAFKSLESQRKAENPVDMNYLLATRFWPPKKNMFPTSPRLDNGLK